MPIIGYYRPSTIVGDRVAAEKILKLENIDKQSHNYANKQGRKKKPKNKIWFSGTFTNKGRNAAVSTVITMIAPTPSGKKTEHTPREATTPMIRNK
jgi:hypothetical protein